MQITLRLLASFVVFAFVGCVFVGPKATAVMSEEATPGAAYQKYMKAEQTIEDNGFRRVLLVDSEGRQTRLRADAADRMTSSFTRTRSDAKQTGVNLVLDKKSSLVRLEVWELPPQTRLSEKAQNDFQGLVNALKMTLGESAINVTK